MKRHLLVGAVLAALVLAGCRGVKSENEPIHPIPNMDNDAGYDPQEPNDLFADGRAMRPPAPGTVARGFLHEDDSFHTGRTEKGNYLKKVPLPVTPALLERGQKRFNIYCAVCHGEAGNGQGIIMTGNYGYTPAPTYHKTALRDTADGYLFDVITNGVRNMPSYAAQVPVADRWAIVTYIRALQQSQNARRENVPPSVLARIEQTGSANMNAARNPAPAAGGGGTGSSSSSSGGSSSGSTDATASDADTTSGSGTSDSGTSDSGTSDSGTSDSGTSDSGTSDSGTSDSGGSADTTASTGTTAPSDTAATAAAAGPAPADSASGGVGAADTGSAGAPVQADAANRADADTGRAGGGASASTAERSSAPMGDSQGPFRGFFGSTFFVIVLVVVPILTLTVILIKAFRKDREH